MQGHLFAMYVEMTRAGNNGERQRKQWLVVPPLPGGEHSHLSCWRRLQRQLKSRTVWKYYVDTDDSMERDFARALTNLERVGWKRSPLITIEIHPGELEQILADPKTPYRLLERVRRVAKAKHGIAI